MPELPEVETVRRVLHERFSGKIIDAVEVARPTFYRPPPKSALAVLRGGRIAAFKRRGKYLIVEIEGRGPVIFHLGMSGRITIGGDGPHKRFSLRIGNEFVYFHDSRRFGRVGCDLPKLGPEPGASDFHEPCLWDILRGRTATIKAILMDQRLISGLGNIYATEALHLARIRPSRLGRSLTREESRLLAAACVEVLRRGVDAGGATLQDESFLDPLGRPGSMQMSVLVYGRETCGTCSKALQATLKRIGGRTSLYCPACQR